MKVKLDYGTILVAGSREFDGGEVEIVESMGIALESILPDDDVLVFHGGAKGTDSFAGEILADIGVHCGVIRPLWDKYGNSAGVLRSRFLASQAEAGILFWNGKSKGTAHTARLLAELNKEFRLCIWDSAANKFKLRDPKEILE